MIFTIAVLAFVVVVTGTDEHSTIMDSWLCFVVDCCKDADLRECAKTLK